MTDIWQKPAKMIYYVSEYIYITNINIFFSMKCLFCKGKNITKKGKRKTKYRVQQVYYCKACKKRFVKKGLDNKTYTPAVMINAINYYNLGYTLQDACCLVNRRFKVKISKSALHNWLSEFSDVCSFRNDEY